MQIRNVKYAGLMAAALGAALLAGAAWAFDAQQGPAPKPAVPEQLATPDISKELNLNDPSVGLPKQPPGTEVRIPGLGVIGVIPKMDFGLELLYGASEPAGKGLQLDNAEPGELGVTGRVKRSF